MIVEKIKSMSLKTPEKLKRKRRECGSDRGRVDILGYIVMLLKLYI